METRRADVAPLPLWVTRSLLGILGALLAWVALDWYHRVTVIEREIVEHTTKGDLAVLATQQCELRLDRMERVYKDMFRTLMEKAVLAPPWRPLPSEREEAE